MTEPSPLFHVSASKRFRARLRHAALTHMPVRLTRGRVTRLKSVRRLAVVERRIYLPHLPEGLEGLRIGHVTDLHIGELVPPSRLPDIITAVRALKADLLALTGDFIDLKQEVLDAVIPAIRQLEAPLGVWLVLGNHDHLVNGAELVRRFQEAGLRVLMGEHVVQGRDGASLVIGGIDFAHRMRELEQSVSRAFAKAPPVDEQSMRLLLAHHPHAFDAACRHDVDLTLSGHTHGGQVILASGGWRKGSLGLGNFGFRYTHGLYKRGYQYLYVSAGVGAWFPLRVRCPAEVACLTLTRRAEDAAGL